MKKLLTVLLLSLALQAFSQKNKTGGHIFNSVTTGKETIGNVRIVSSYYSLKNNIADRTSAVFISENPTLKQIERAAIGLPSDNFVVWKDSAVLSVIMLKIKPAKEYLMVNTTTHRQQQFPSALEGDITENRAREIIAENYDPEAKIEGEYLFFNDKELKIISNADIKKEVLALLEKLSTQ